MNTQSTFSVQSSYRTEEHNSASIAADLQDTHLVVFMTANMSLAEWDRLGMLDREVEAYRRLAAHCASVTIVSYGHTDDLKIAKRMPELRVVCNRWRLPLLLFEAYVTHLALRPLRGRLIVKTNQSHGGELALRVAQRLQGRFVARCGYLVSFVGAQKFGAGSTRAAQEEALERRLFLNADQVVVTTEAMRHTALAHGVESTRIHVIPNYVVMEWFTPPEHYNTPVRRIGFVGRLSGEKNLPALVCAAAKLGIELALVGDGPERRSLEELVHMTGCQAHFFGRRPYREIPGILATCQMFVLPSLYEGHPKALIEGMAVGLPVVGTNVPGIREAIVHGETGWLAETDALSLQTAIAAIAGDSKLRERLGRAARRKIEATLALDRVLELELNMLTTTLESARQERG